MAWRQVTESDLTSSLSRDEVEAFRASSDVEADPVTQQIANTVAYVRGCIRSGGSAALASDDGYLPESLIGPAMDYARYKLLVRFNIAVNESRAKLYDDARDLFDAVRDNEFIPESASEDDSNEKAATPAAAPATPDRLLD